MSEQAGPSVRAFFTQAEATGDAWLREMGRALGSPGAPELREVARSTLHALRDRLTVQESARFAGQLPVTLRGLYYQGWKPTDEPIRVTREADFLAAVRRAHGGPLSARQAACALFKVLEAKIRAGQIEDVRALLPAPLLGLWPRLDLSPASGANEPEVRSAMTRSVLYSIPQRPLRLILELMEEQRVRHLLVVGGEVGEGLGIPDEEILGILSTRDVLRHLRKAPEPVLESLTVADVMTHAPLHTIDPSASLTAAAAQMRKHGVSALPVLEHQQLLGLITSEDLLKAAYTTPVLP